MSEVVHTNGSPAPILWHRRPRIQKRLRLLARLVRMSPAEIAHRIGRVMAKRLYVRPSLPPPTQCARDLLPAAMHAEPVAYLSGRDTATGFFRPSERERLARLAVTAMPALTDRTVTEAEAILREGVELLGRQFRPADPSFDWLADPDRGRLWPFLAMNDADAVRRVQADVKFVWEVNRHQFLAVLARAYAYTGREEFAEPCVAMVERWIEANPPGVGVNWSSNLEVAIRSISWLWTIQLLLGARALDDRRLRLWLASLRQHRDYLVDHLSTYTDPTNHLIGEAAALAMISLWLPEWERSAACRDLALTTLADALGQQVADDGVDVEQATSYQRFVLDLVLQVIALAERNVVSIPVRLRERAEAMLAATAALVGPSCRAPRIGDSDDARGLPFFSADPWDFGELLALGRAVLGSTTSVCAGHGLAESAFWLAATPGQPNVAAAKEPTAAGRPQLLSQGGYAILPLPAGPASDRLIFDCGPLGYLPHCSHGHADLLSVLVNAGGEEFLVDPGSFAYYDELGRRDLFRSTRAHNTVEVGGRDQADAFDPFKWLNIPRTGLEIWRLGQSFHYAEAWHDGYRRIVPAARHRRGVLALAGGWIVIDWLEGHGTQQFDRWFHVAPQVSATLADAGAVELQGVSSGNRLRIEDLGRACDSAGLTSTSIGTAPYSERYGRMCEAPVVRFADRAPMPALRLTLIARGGDSTHGLRAIDVQGQRAGGALSVTLVDACGRRVELLARTAKSPRAQGTLATDGRLAVAIEDAPGASSAETLVSGGSFVENRPAR